MMYFMTRKAVVDTASTFAPVFIFAGCCQVAKGISAYKQEQLLLSPPPLAKTKKLASYAAHLPPLAKTARPMGSATLVISEKPMENILPWACAKEWKHKVTPCQMA
eukprot:scaffold20497_cov51-Attheya_sp.AAC.5